MLGAVGKGSTGNTNTFKGSVMETKPKNEVRKGWSIRHEKQRAASEGWWNEQCPMQLRVQRT